MSIYVDGCCNKTIGSCSSVTDEKGNCLITSHLEFLRNFPFLNDYELITYKHFTLYRVNFTDVKQQQNNGAELLAMVIGLLIARYYNVKHLYSDSTLMIKYWSKEAKKPIADKRKSDLRDFCILLATDFRNNGGTIHFVKGNENVSDIGFHKDKAKK